MTLLLLLFKEHFFFPPRQPTCPLPLGPEMDSSASFIPFCSFFLSVYADVEKENKRTKESLTVEDKERKVCVVLLKRLLSPTLCVSLGPTYMSHSYLGLPGSLDVISLIDAPPLCTWTGLKGFSYSCFRYSVHRSKRLDLKGALYILGVCVYYIK